MSDSPSVDDFIRHMQAELDACEDIVDKVERQKKQWQIEAAILQAMDFTTRFQELTKIGSDPLEIVQALTMPEGPDAMQAKQALAKVGGFCPSCGTNMDSDLNFCTQCGEYVE